MLDDVIGAYLDTLSEREFDIPFLSLLRSLGFTHIHALHGAFEFGKDFIARRQEEGVTKQYAFQSKAGKVDLSVWHGLRGQLDQLRTNALAHPAFDAKASRRAVLVVTGKLIGGAPLEAQQYRAHLGQLQEIDFETWERETLVSYLAKAPEAGLAGSYEGPLLALVGRIEQQDVSASEIEAHASIWTEGVPLPRAAVEAGLVAQRLARSQRPDLAALAVVGLLRAVWARAHGLPGPPAEAVELADNAWRLYEFHARYLYEAMRVQPEPRTAVRALGSSTSAVTYPAWSLRTAELVALLGLYYAWSGRVEEATATASDLAHFLSAHPGASHPPSDRWAASLLPVAALLAGRHSDDLAAWLRKVASWVADHYEQDRCGLASWLATPQQEVERLFGSPFEHLDLPRRAESLLAAAVLDCAALAQLSDVYEDALNDYLAVELHPFAIEAADDLSQYIKGAGTSHAEVNMRYAEDSGAAARGAAAAHHTRAPNNPYLIAQGRPVDLLAMSALLRDRYSLPALRACMELAKRKK